MSGPLRRAGRGRTPDGATVTWTVSEGRRGRRWRESVLRDGTVVLSLLLETDPGRRFAHLELTTPAGLLTLHPEGDGTLHGNAVTEGGVVHVRGLPWMPDSVVLVEGSIMAAVAAEWLAASLPSRAGRSMPGLTVEADLRVAAAAYVPGSTASSVDGLPILADAVGWPLEEG